MIGASEDIAIVGTIDSASQSTSEKLTDAIDLSKFSRFLFVINAGVLGTSATLDFQIKGATSAGGSYTAITGTAITQLVKATDDGKQVVVEISRQAVENLGLGYTHIKGSLVPGTAASQAAVVALGVGPFYGPAADHDLADVAQILTLVN